MRRSTASLFAALLLAGTAAAAHPEAAIKDSHRPAADTARDADRKPAALLEFAKIDHGKKVVDFIAGHGYFTRLFAVAVKPGGSVVAIVSAAGRDHDAEALTTLTAHCCRTRLWRRSGRRRSARSGRAGGRRRLDGAELPRPP